MADESSIRFENILHDALLVAKSEAIRAELDTSSTTETVKELQKLVSEVSRLHFGGSRNSFRHLVVQAYPMVKGFR